VGAPGWGSGRGPHLTDEPSENQKNQNALFRGVHGPRILPGRLPTLASRDAPPRKPFMTFRQLMHDLQHDREDR
jgi:hypothetical protein